MRRGIPRILALFTVVAGLVAFGITFPVPSSTTFAQAQRAPAGPSTGTAVDLPQDPTKNPRSPSYNPQWGTVVQSIRQVHAYQFVPIDSAVTYSFVNTAWGSSRYHTGGNAWFEASVSVPSGVKLVAFELAACDTDASNDIAAWLMRHTNAGTTIYGGSLTSGTPGCGYYYYDLSAANLTVNNFVIGYSFEVALTGTTNTTSFREVNFYYQLQVSPAPASASFTDVPTGHPFFQYIEALKAAGITGGCTATTYCPNDPVTRGQMAVFLARGFGLNWWY